MIEKYTCPVCGYGMQDPPRDYNICPSCGTEFGHHDVNSSINNLRAEWLRSGAKWWSPIDDPPSGWDPYAQISNALTVSSLEAIFGFRLSSGQVDHSEGLARMAAASGGNTDISVFGLGLVNSTAHRSA